MKFVSDILAKAGLVVDGVVTFNNTATGQTPAANDNSTKLATTAWVQNYVVPYSLPIASGSILGGIKVGTGLTIDGSGVLSIASGGGSATTFRSDQTFIATAGQTTFTVTNGYTPDFIDIFLNGVYLSKTEYTATNGSTIVLNDTSLVNDIITVISYSPYIVGETPSARDICRITATAGQTTFVCTYAVGQIDVYYNGSKLDTSEYTATNGTSVILGTAALDGDKIEIITWLVGGGIGSDRTITINGVTYDLSANRTWSTLPTGGNAGQLLSKVDGSDYNVQWIDEAPAASYTSQLKHRVKSSQAITKGQAVYVSSADGTNMIISKASNASEGTSSKTMGLLESTVAINGTANVITEGLLTGLDTTGANAAGDPVWLGTNGDLIYGLANKPVAPAHLVFIGVVTRRNANNGEIFVKVQNGFEMGELHDYVQNGVQNNDVIAYESSTSLYKPKSIATLLGYTPANPANYLALTGGTLTGGLTGTTATFSSWLSIGGGSEGLRLGNVGDNSSYDNVKLYYTGYNSASPRIYLTPRTTPGSGTVNTFLHLQNTNGTSTSSNNTMGLIVDSAIGVGAIPSYLLDLYTATSGTTSTVLRLKNGFNDTSTGLRMRWDFASLAGAYLDVTTDSGGSKTMTLYLSSANAAPTQVFEILGSNKAAIFSGSVTANATSTFSNGSGLSAIFSNGGAAGNYNSIELRGGTIGSAVNWQISKDNSTANAFELAPSTTAGGTTYGSPVFKIVSSGAATFSSSVESTRYYITPSGTNNLYNIVNAASDFAGSYTFQAGGGSSGFGGAIIAYGHSHASKAGWITAGISANSGGKFTVNTQALGGGTDVFVVQQNGNVGIGTTNPSSKLQIADGGISNASGSNNINVYGSVSAGDAAQLYLYQKWNSLVYPVGIGATYDTVYGAAAAAMSFYVSAYNGSGVTTTRAMYINPAGNVGIGTSSFTDVSFGSPILKLYGSRATLALTSTGSLSTIAMIAAGDTTKAIHFNQENTGALRIYQYAGGAESFTLLGNGNLGLSVINPSHRLQVSGNIYSSDTVYGRNLKPEAWASVSAGSPTSSGIPHGYSMISISSPCDGNWRPILNNINDTKAYFWASIGDAASKDTANYFMSMTSPAYGVYNFGVVSYQDNGWNTGSFEFTYDNNGSGTHRLLVRCTSYYNGGNTAYGNIYFLRIE